MTVPLEVHSIPTGPLQANCHILRDPESNRILVVDPGDDPEELLAFVNKIGGEVEAIWNTHAHIDHVNANGPLAEATGAPISIHRLEAPFLSDPVRSGATWIGIELRPSRATHEWDDGQELQGLGRQWTVHHSPGHSPGSCAVVCREESLMLGGDLLFQGSIGRTDLPGGSPADMARSLRRMCEDWGRDSYRVLTGHGPNTTIGTERKENQFLLYLRENGWVLPG